MQIYDPVTGAETQTITPPVATARRFGASVALKGGYLLIGAPGTPDTVGAVFVYTSRANGRWVYREMIEGTAAGIGSGFGESVAVHLDQGIIGAPRDDRKTSDGGAVYFHDLPAPETIVGITVSDRLYTYDGTPKSVTITTTPPNVPLTVLYNGSEEIPVDAANYLVRIQIAAPNFYFPPDSEEVASTMEIERAPLDLELSSIPILRPGGPPGDIVARTTDGINQDQVALTIADPSVATVSGLTVVAQSPGVTTLTASVPQTRNYLATPVRTTTIIVEDEDATFQAGSTSELTDLPGSANVKRLGERVAVFGNWAVASKGNNFDPAIVIFRRSPAGTWSPTQEISLDAVQPVGSLAIGEGVIAVGVPAQGFTFVYEQDGAEWKLRQSLPANPATNNFGREVAVSQDGSRIFSSFFFNTGAARVEVFKKETFGDWIFSQRLEGGPADQVSFGNAIVEEDGLLVIAGNQGNAGSGNITGFSLDPATGLYSDFASTAPLEGGATGTDLVISDGLIIAGAPNAYVDTNGNLITDPDPATHDRGALVYLRPDIEGRSFEIETIYGLLGNLGGVTGFGSDIALGENGDILAVTFEDSGIGSELDATFHLIRPSVIGPIVETVNIDGDSIFDLDRLAYQLTGGGELAGDGTTLMVGAYRDDAGSFEAGSVRVLGISPFFKLVDTAVVPPSPSTTVPLTIAARGDTVVVGAALDSQAGSQAGRVLIFDRSRGLAVPITEKAADTPAAGQKFGNAVAVSDDHLFVAAVNAGEVQIFGKTDDFAYSHLQTLTVPAGETGVLFGHGIAIDTVSSRQTLAVTSPSEGKVFVFHKGETFWEFSETLTGFEENFLDGYTTNVALDATRLAIGDPKANGGFGVVSLFTFDETAGAYGARTIVSSPDIVLPGGGFDFTEQFGRKVAFSGDLLVATSRPSDRNGSRLNLLDASEDLIASFVVPDSRGDALAASTGRIALGAAGPMFSDGRLDVFTFDATLGWRLERSLNGIDGYTHQLGNSVALGRDYAVSGQVYQANSEKAGLAIIGLPDRSLADWALLFGLTGEDATPLGDANNDGFPNLISYAFNLSPLAPPDDIRDALPQTPTVTADTAFVSVKIPENPRENVRFVIEQSTDLANWSAVARKTGSGPWLPVSGTVTEGAASNGSVSTTFSIPRTPERGLYRLRLDLNP